MLRGILAAAIVLTCACSGKLGVVARDGGAPIDAGPEDLCRDVRCPAEQVCERGACVSVDPCAGVTCEGGVTVCSYGSCGNASVDEDGDGSPAAEDCDDRNVSVLAGSTRPCDGDCGAGVSTCVGGAWGACTTPEPCACSAGATGELSCGRCGTATATCGDDGRWGAPTACTGEGACGAGTEGIEPCPVGGLCSLRRRACSAACTWEAWGDCESQTECDPGSVEAEDCGFCGTHERSCSESCLWNAFSDCEGEGVCAPGATDDQGCGDCGIQERTCSGDCAWSAFGGCTGEGACSAGDGETRGCGDCGDQSRTCSGSCAWGSWGSCTGEGACTPGDTESRGCGDCGSQARTCAADCSWGSYGACGGEGVCSPGTVEQQGCGGGCGTQNRTCSAGCAWGGWSGCSGTCCSQVAANWCAAKGWPVVGAAQGGNIVCTSDGRGDANNCDTCATYNIVVWQNGSQERYCPGAYSTVAGGVYGAHTPCACGDNLPFCENWDMQGCIPN